MENSVGVMKNIFRAESFFQIAASIGDKFQINCFRKLFYKIAGKIWTPPIFMRN